MDEATHIVFTCSVYQKHMEHVPFLAKTTSINSSQVEDPKCEDIPPHNENVLVSVEEAEGDSVTFGCSTVRVETQWCPGPPIILYRLIIDGIRLPFSDHGEPVAVFDGTFAPGEGNALNGHKTSGVKASRAQGSKAGVFCQYR